MTLPVYTIETVKIKKTKWFIVFNDKEEYGQPFKTMREAECWKFKCERFDKNEAEAKIVQRAYRLEAVKEYLAKRALRPVQLVMEF